MSNLDLTIAEIMHGDTQVLKIMKGDKQKWPYVPYDAEVEYLETDGDAYIDTGVIGSSNTKFDLILYEPQSSTTSMPFGARKTFSPLLTIEWVCANDASNWQWRYGNKTTSLAWGSSAHVGIYTLNNLSQANKISFTCGTSHTQTATNNTFNTGINIWLFCVNGDGIQRGKLAGVRFYTAKFYDGSTLVRDYIAVRKDGIGYLYDKVSGTFFGNANSSGAFTFGNDV